MLENEIQNIISSNNILDFVEKTTILTRKTEELCVGICPFHRQFTPTFFVDIKNQEFRCLECGRSGNLLDFVHIYSKSFYKTAEIFNIELPIKEEDNEYYKICTEAAKWFYSNMKSSYGKVGYGYFRENRRFLDYTINHFGMGYSYKKGLYNHLLSLGFSKESILDSGLCREGDDGSIYDFFRNRAMIPIINEDGKIVGFGGRALNGEKNKYINSSDHPLFDKSSMLFALNFAKDSKRKGLIICEGYMDVVSMHQAGFDNAVASLGTAFTSEHAKLIKKYTNGVWLAYDSDEAGVIATQKNIKILRDAGVQARIIDMKPYKDPDEFIKNLGAEEFNNRILNAKDSIEFEIDVIFSRCKHKSSYKKEVTKFLFPIMHSMDMIKKYVSYADTLLQEIP